MTSRQESIQRLKTGGWALVIIGVLAEVIAWRMDTTSPAFLGLRVVNSNLAILQMILMGAGIACALTGALFFAARHICICIAGDDIVKEVSDPTFYPESSLRPDGIWVCRCGAENPEIVLSCPKCKRAYGAIY